MSGSGLSTLSTTAPHSRPAEAPVYHVPLEDAGELQSQLVVRKNESKKGSELFN